MILSITVERLNDGDLLLAVEGPLAFNDGDLLLAVEGPLALATQ